MIKYHDKIISDDVSDNIKIRFETNGLSKGLYIKCCVDKLTKIMLYGNRHPLLNYNKLEIYHFCKKINNNLLYVSFDLSYDINDNTFESYQCGINFSRFDCLEVNLLFSGRKSVKNYIK